MAATPETGQLVNDIQATKNAVEAQDLKQRKVLSTLYDLNQRMRKTVSEKSKMSSERVALEESIQQLNSRLQELDLESSVLKARLGERLKAIHRLGGFSLGRALLSATSSSSLDRNLKILGIVAGHDRDLVKEYRSVHDEIDTKKDRVAKRIARLTQIETGLKDREERMLTEQKLKSKLLDGIRKKRLFAEHNLEDLKKKSQSMSGGDDAALDALFKPSFADAKGTLTNPVDGHIARNFGTESSHDHSWTISHKGIRFAANLGEPVKSVFGGTVAWVGHVSGLGQSLVIDHGDHYYTVFANAGKILVRPGEDVAKGQTLATAGTATLEQGAGIYFEIRHFSEPTDPQLWLKGTSL